MATKQEIKEATSKVYEAMKELESLVSQIPSDIWANPKDEDEADDNGSEAYDIALALFPLYTKYDNAEVDLYFEDLTNKGGWETVDG